MSQQELLPPVTKLPQPILGNLVPMSNELSLAPILEISAQLAPFTKAVTNLEEQGLRVKIDSHESFQRGTEFLSICKQNSEQLESFRVSVKKPIDDYAKLVQSLFKPMIERLGEVSRMVGQHMLSFQRVERDRLELQQREARKRQEEEALAMAAERERQGDTEAAAAIMDAATMAPMPVAAPRMAVTNSFGQRAQTSSRWVGAVENPMGVVQAIVNGKLPISLINWSQSELNDVAKKIKVAGVHLGIKVSQEDSFGMRR